MRDQSRYFESISNACLIDLVNSSYFIICSHEANANMCYYHFWSTHANLEIIYYKKYGK